MPNPNDPNDPIDPNDPTRVPTKTATSYPNEPPVGTSSIAPDPDAPRVVSSTTTYPGEPPVVTQSYTPPPPPPEVRVETIERRGGPGWLLPLLLLLGLGLLAWYFLSQRDRDTADLPPMDAPRAEAPAEPATPVGPASVREREPVAAADTPARKPTAPASPVDREPEAIARVRPDYPPKALRDGEEGTVVVRALVGTDGLPSDVDIARSSRSRLLDRAAVDAVRKWRFSPAMRDGRKVAAAVEVPVDFIASEYR